MSHSILTRDFYKQMLEVSAQLELINSKLTGDRALIDKYMIGLPEMDAAGIINYCILYDLGQAVKKIKGDIITDSLEAAGLIIVSNKIVRGANSDLLAGGYESLVDGYEKGLYQNLAQYYLRIVNDINPFRLKAGDLGFSSLPPDQVVPTWLSLPPALKQMNHPLFDEYAGLLYRFAEIIAGADGHLSREEEERLQQIHGDIYDPYAGV